jgi:hypothetical protein
VHKKGGKHGQTLVIGLLLDSMHLTPRVVKACMALMVLSKIALQFLWFDGIYGMFEVDVLFLVMIETDERKWY